jgi:hypothetical protein
MTPPVIILLWGLAVAWVAPALVAERCCPPPNRRTLARVQRLHVRIHWLRRCVSCGE